MDDSGVAAEYPVAGSGHRPQPGMARLRAVVRDMWDELSGAERAVARHLTSAPAESLLVASAQQLGAASGTSNATVVRALQRLGYAGLPALKRDIATEFEALGTPEARLQRRVASSNQDVEHAWEQVFDEAAGRLEECRRLGDPDTLAKAVTILAEARWVLAYGVAANEPVARHLALALGRIGRRAGFSGRTGFPLADDLLPLGHGDAVVVFQPGRMLGEFTVLIERARAVGARVVLITDALGEALGDQVDAVLTAPYTPTGITADFLPGLIIADAMLLALGSMDRTAAVDHAHQLAMLREQLVGTRKPRTRKD